MIRHAAAGLAAGIALTAMAGCGDGAPGNEATTPSGGGAAVLHVAPGGSDSAPGSAAAPLAGIDEAFARAQPGDVIQLAPGAYPRVTIGARAPADRVITLRGSDDGPSTVDGIEILGRGVEVDGITTPGWAIREDAHDITLRDVTTTGGAFITGASGIRIIGGEITGAVGLDGLQVKASGTGAEGGGTEPRDILVDGLHIRDISRGDEGTAHTECMQFTAGIGVIVRNSRFDDCSTQGVFLKEGLGGEIRDVVFENNSFGALNGFNSLVVDDGVTDVEVRYNSFAQPPRLGGEGSARIVAIGNAGALTTCAVGVEYRYNAWSDVACGASDRVGDLGFTDPQTGDLTVGADSPARDAGDPADHPRTDLRGMTRPEGAAPDAGAYEG